MAFALRACVIVFDIPTGPPGEFIRFGKPTQDASTSEDANP